VAILVSGVIGYLVTRSIVNPLNAVVQAASRFADRKMHTQVQIKSKDELGQLADSEEAVKIKEDQGADVTVLTVGLGRAENELRTALAMGADQAILIETEGEELDEYSGALRLYG